MKRLIFSITSLIVTLVAYGQTNAESYDSLLTKTIQKQIAFPDINNLDSSGTTLIKFYKSNDSLNLDVLYASGIEFNLNNDIGLRRRLNKYKDKFPNGYIAFIPLYFDYYKEGEESVPLNINTTKLLQQEIKNIGKKSHILKPIHISGYQAVR